MKRYAANLVQQPHSKGCHCRFESYRTGLKGTVMQKIRIDFNSNLELVTIVFGCLGFLVQPKTILNGKDAVLDRLKSCRSYNFEMTQEVTDEELVQGASMLMNTPGITDWANNKLQYQI